MTLPEYLINPIRKNRFLASQLPNGLHTVCQAALCPNRGECFSNKQMTFLILGNRCTRSCKFCAIDHGIPNPIDPSEKERIIETIRKFNLSYVVITSVTRDDLSDGGAQQFADIINMIHNEFPNIRVEVLTPDFQGNISALTTVLNANPFIFNHNLEAVPQLFQHIRPQGNFECSLSLLNYTKKHFPHIKLKSGIMVGIGETNENVIEMIRLVATIPLDIFTIGQYLAPSNHHYPVKRYVTPTEFSAFADFGNTIEMKVFAGPLVRSSYHAQDLA